MNGLGNLLQADTITGQTLRHDLDLDLVFPATDDEALADILHLAEALQQVQRKQSQGAVIHILGPQGQRDHRDIINADRLDQRLGDVGWNLVYIGLQLVMHLDH